MKGDVLIDQMEPCIFCPNEGGAYKQTNNSSWCHLLCAVWIPECHISNVALMEPVEAVESIPKSRWKLVSFLLCEFLYMFFSNYQLTLRIDLYDL